MKKFIFERSFSVFSAVPLIQAAEAFSENGISVAWGVWGIITIIFMQIDAHIAEKNGW